MADIEISGLADLQKMLDSLPGKIEGNLMRGALRAGTKVMADEAKARVPVLHSDLKKSIRVSFKSRSKKFGWVRMHLIAGNKKAWYAHLIEFGTASFYEGSGRTVGAPYEIKPKTKKSLFFGGVAREKVVHPGIKPQPFMRRTFDTKQGEAVQTMADYLRRRIPIELAKQ